MTLNEIPKAIGPVTSLAAKALAGALAWGEEKGLEHNTHVELSADLFDLTGDPATPQVPGKQAVLNASKAAVTEAYAALRVTIQDGQEFCRVGIALLKASLGTRHNADWLNAGFLTPSLAVPEDPVPMLLQFRQFLRAHPAKENAGAGITAAEAQAMFAAIQSASLAVASARDARREAKKARDAALRKLRKRLSNLRAELAQLLTPDDGSWEQFGFRIPAAGRLPAKVPEVTLTPGGPKLVLAKWGLASLRESHRVSWRLAEEGAAWTQVGIFTERQCAIPDLPAGALIIVGVTARNAAGETTPTEAQIEVPS